MSIPENVELRELIKNFDFLANSKIILIKNRNNCQNYIKFDTQFNNFF